MKIIKKGYPIKPFNKFCGEDIIQIFQFIRKKRKNGLIFEPVSTIPLAFWAGE